MYNNMHTFVRRGVLARALAPPVVLAVLALCMCALLPLAVLGGCVVKNAECFVDSDQRVLSPDNVNWADSLNNEWCAQMCSDRGFAFAGTEDSKLVASSKLDAVCCLSVSLSLCLSVSLSLCLSVCRSIERSTSACFLSLYLFTICIYTYI